MDSVTQLAHEVLLERRGQAKHIAATIGKPYATLLREVNPYDKAAKLGADTLLEIMKVTKNVSPLEHMARELGLKLVKAD